jgi:hypothetical protein
MRIIIEDAETLQFLTMDGGWTGDSARAATFANSDAARERGVTLPIGEFNIVGAFSKSPQLTNLDNGSGTRKTAAGACSPR